MVQLGEPSPSVCMAFPALSAVHEGYRVFAVINASGTDSKMAEEITLVRIVQTGVVPMDTAAVASELQTDLAQGRCGLGRSRGCNRSSWRTEGR
jgi:hypothetical protein